MNHRRLCWVGWVALLAAGQIASAAEKVIYEKRSAYNNIVVADTDDGLRTLSFDPTCVQGAIKLGDPDHLGCKYAEVMPVGLAFVEKPQRVLIVGLGVGMIPTFLHKHYPHMQIDVVELDPEVVAVAKKFFGFREDDALRVHVGDGRRFIEECRHPYDIIFLDAYGSDNIPYALATREFLQAVRRALTPKGIAVANLFSSESNRLYHSMVRTYQEVFDELYVQGVRERGNVILIAMPHQRKIPLGELERRARRISKEKQFRFDMGDFVRDDCRYADEKDSQGRILMDKKQ